VYGLCEVADCQNVSLAKLCVFRHWLNSNVQMNLKQSEVGCGTGDLGLGTEDRGLGTEDRGLRTEDRGLGTEDRDKGLGTGLRTRD
jgi:hypothetical protein